MSSHADRAALLLRETSCLIGLPDDPAAWTDPDRRRLASRVLADARHHDQTAQRAAANALTRAPNPREDRARD